MNYAEQATGCRATIKDGGPIYNDRGIVLTDDEAQDALLAGETIHVPNAGAGSYHDVLQRLHFSEVELFESSSSAGDWTIAAFDGLQWMLVCQSNRYPCHGFSYSLCEPLITGESLAELGRIWNLL